jgi:NagD protein
MIGDTMDTDILGGVQLGFHTVLVLSGGTKREDLSHYAFQPELVVESIANLHQLLVEKRWEPWWGGRNRPVVREAAA